MTNQRVDEIFEQVKHIICMKEPKGYKITIDQKDVHLPLATNFEWRMDKPARTNHMYFGTETGKFQDVSFSISFDTPCKVRIQNADARCYVYVTPME
jgi:hypothetical protein